MPKSRKLISFVCLLTLAQMPTLTVGEAQEVFQKNFFRYRVETDQTATFYVGKQGSFKIVLFDQYGKRHAAPEDLKTTITVTTLGTPDEARKWIDSQTTKPRPSLIKSRARTITLDAGQKAAQLTISHQRGAEEVSVSLLSRQAGVLYIFVESSGITSGDTTVAVVKPRSTFLPRAARPFASVSPAVRMMPIAFQEPADQFKLDLQPVKPLIQPAQGCQVGYLKVLLRSGDDELVQAPQDVTVVLQVEDGEAWFEPDTLIIPKGDVISPQQAALKTRPGGVITVSASTNRINNISVAPVTKKRIQFNAVPHSTALSLQKQRDTAYANGLDELELRVEALQEGRAIPPEDEGMAERKIYFRFIGDSQGVKFENGKGELTIPKGQQTGVIKLFSNRSVSDLKVVAESLNGLQSKISSGDDGVPIGFSFPWFPMLCALSGGLVFPLLRRDLWLGLARGAVAGGILFGLALFGAVLSDPQKIGTISVAVTKLPTENALASFILGFLGSILLGVIFIGAQRYKTATATR